MPKASFFLLSHAAGDRATNSLCAWVLVWVGKKSIVFLNEREREWDTDRRKEIVWWRLKVENKVSFLKKIRFVLFYNISACFIFYTCILLLPSSHLLHVFSLSLIPTHSHLVFFSFFSAIPSGMQDLSSLTRDRTHTPCSGSEES